MQILLYLRNEVARAAGESSGQIGAMQKELAQWQVRFDQTSKEI